MEEVAKSVLEAADAELLAEVGFNDEALLAAVSEHGVRIMALAALASPTLEAELLAGMAELLFNEAVAANQRNPIGVTSALVN